MQYFMGAKGFPSYVGMNAHIQDLGMLYTPESWRTPFCPYACDNGVFAAWTKGKVWDEAMHCAYLGMLDKVSTQDRQPEWVLLPDAVADWSRTVELASLYLPLLRGRGLNVAIALQDGCDFAQVLDFSPDWVFVAGSTAWKESNIHAATEFFHPLGIRVHVGRVNTRRRLRLCQSAGVDSADGTTLNKFARETVGLVRDTLAQPCLRI